MAWKWSGIASYMYLVVVEADIDILACLVVGLDSWGRPLGVEDVGDEVAPGKVPGTYLVVVAYKGEVQVGVAHIQLDYTVC